MRALILLTAFLWLIWPASAFEQAERRMLTEAEAEEWIAVGRLNLAGRAYCTATLITPTRVLTAAHCLFHPKTLRPVRLGDVHFVAGWRRGAYRAHRKAKRLILHPEFDIHATGGKVRHDLAIIELEAPIGREVTAPLNRIGNAHEGNAVFTITYGRDRPHLPSTENPCFVVKPLRWAIGLTCAAPFGASGGPVFRTTSNGLRLVGVISGKVERPGELRAYAVRLSNVLPQVMEAAK